MRRTLVAVGLAAVFAVTAVGCSENAAPPGVDGAGASSQPAPATTPTPSPWAWRTEAPATLGFRSAPLDRLARQARRAGSSCWLVARDDAIVAERDWGVPADQPREVFSVTKSVTSALVGIAVRDGLVDVDDRVSRWVPSWRGTPSARVTVRNLLSNDSGRHWSVRGDYQFLLGSQERTRFAVGLRQQFTPGTTWIYNNSAIQVLEQVLRRASGMSLADYAEEQLFAPLGMTDTHFPARNASTAFSLQTTCRDLARFGRLYADGGEIDGRRILPRSWIRQSTGRPSTEHNAAYGYLWWLNRPGLVRGATDPIDEHGQPTHPTTGQIVPGAPEDLYAAIGFGGQVVLVDPDSRTVVVRLGNPGAERQLDYGFAQAGAVITSARR